MKTAMLTAAILLAVPTISLTQDKCANAEDQATMSECADDAFAKSDKKLNELYKRIKARLANDADIRKLLAQAQRDWIKFRDAECDFQTAGVAGGSVRPMLIAMCMNTLTQSRIEDFKGYLKCEEGDLSCPVPAAD